MHSLPAAFVAGITSHLLYFIKGERNREAGAIAIWFIASFALLALLFYLHCGSLLAVFSATFILEAAFFTGLGSSIATYRLAFHRTCKYPGRTLDALTKWSAASMAYKTERYHAYLRSLHAPYGDFIRTGPQEISINNVDAIKAVYGRGSPCLKGPWYDLGGTGRNLHRTRDPHLHAKQREIWERGFQGKLPPLV